MTQVIQGARHRPWLTPLVGAGLAAAIMLFPVSYDRTTAYDAKIALAAPEVRPEQLTAIATEMKRALNAENVSVMTMDGRVEFVARVPTERAAGLAAVARAFAGELTARHLEASATLTPVITKVQGNVYAMATNRTININIQRDGRTDAQLADDIRSQLHAAGLDVDNVEYQRDGNKETLKIMMDGDGSGHPPGEEAQINLTVDGQQPQGQKLEVRVHPEPGDTDETIRQRILAQLRSQGVEAEVVVRDGKVVSIDPIRH